MTNAQSEWKRPTWTLVLVPGLYVLGLVGAALVQRQMLGHPSAPDRVVATVLWLQLLGRCPAAVAALALIAWRKPDDLRSRVLDLTLATGMRVVLLTVFVSLVFNASGLWPFLWRWPQFADYSLATHIVKQGAIGLAVLWLVAVGFLTPLVEEISFRFAFIQTVRKAVSTDIRAAFLVGVVFAAAHLVANPTSRPHLINAAWLLAWSVPVGLVALQRPRGGVGIATLCHGARNITDVAMLLASVVAMPK